MGRPHKVGMTCIAFAQPSSYVAKYFQRPTSFLAIQQVFKDTLELRIMSLDLSLSHCSEIGFRRVETWLVGKATGSEQGHFQAERARLCQLGYRPHKNLFVCVLFWMLGDVGPP